MHPILLQFGQLRIYSWGFMVAVAFAVAIYIGMKRAEKEGISNDQALDISAITLITSLFGARLFYVIGFWNEFSNNWLSVFAVWEGGMVFYGGLIMSMLALWIYTKKNKINILKMFDAIAPAAAVGYAIGRIGCYLRGCCYGLECSLPWATHFPDVKGFVHPTQLYSVIAGIIIFILLMFIGRKKNYDGQIFVWGILLYSIYRFIIEFFRFNELNWAGLSPSQWISVAFALFAVLALFFMRAKTVIK